ncbi:MAG: DUF4019 domain-containing protein [Candidatus Omnitrophica bacterium]|nr:DUF4019 domain-containing protein [Candidatus Omnitrophota bacterium]
MMHIKYNAWLWILLVMFLLNSTIVTAVAEKEDIKKELAFSAAIEWLNLIDNEKFFESWERAAPIFKDSVDNQTWHNSLKHTSLIFGKVLSREIISQEYETTLPGAPDGEYFIMQFKTSFEKKEEAIETIVPMLDKDGLWKVSGYYIK